MSEHHDYVPPKITNKDESLLKEFLDENQIEKGFSYRKGAGFTAHFGIEQGWGKDWKPGLVRIHPGVDRAGGGTTKNNIKDVVICPFNFDSSDFKDYKNKGYGSLVFLKSNKYQFEMRIAHMDPKKNIIPWALKQFQAKKPYDQSWLIGSAGSYGYSTGAHTHTELVSIDESCKIFELLLYQRYGFAAFKEYSDEYIIKYYRQQVEKYPDDSPYKDWNDGEILQDWLNQKRKKGIFFINKHKCCFFYKNKPWTKYATNSVADFF